MSRIFKEIRIPSSSESLSMVENFVDEICEAYYITNSYYSNILIAILEGVKNAILHGNKKNPEKQVKLSGFNFRNVPSPIEAAEGQTENVGKGIFLICSLADQVSYNSKGNVVEIVFFISSINQETTLNRISQVHRYFNKQKSLA